VSVPSGGAQDKREERYGSGPRVPAFLLAAASLLIVLGGVWSLTTISKLRNEVRRNQLELARLGERQEKLPSGVLAEEAQSETAAEERQQASQRREGSSRPLESVEVGTVPSRSFLLTAGTLRSGGTAQVLRMPSKPGLAEFHLDLGFADYEAYRAVIYDSQAVELMSLSQLRAQVQEDEILVAFSVSSERFTPGDYYISLSGVIEKGELEPVARYDFRISSE
jgi:hypothetical protein